MSRIKRNISFASGKLNAPDFTVKDKNRILPCCNIEDVPAAGRMFFVFVSRRKKKVFPLVSLHRIL